MSLHSVPLAALLLLVAAAAPAALAEPPRCTHVGCVHAHDDDGDGDADEVNAALAAAFLTWLNVNANRTNVSWWGGVTFEEHEPLHGPDDKAPGVESWGYANLTADDGGPGFNATEADVLAYFSDHETGAVEPVLARWLYAGDADRDGVPDRCGGMACLALP